MTNFTPRDVVEAYAKYGYDWLMFAEEKNPMYHRVMAKFAWSNQYKPFYMRCVSNAGGYKPKESRPDVAKSLIYFSLYPKKESVELQAFEIIGKTIENHNSLSAPLMYHPNDSDETVIRVHVPSKRDSDELICEVYPFINDLVHDDLNGESITDANLGEVITKSCRVVTVLNMSSYYTNEEKNRHQLQVKLVRGIFKHNENARRAEDITFAGEALKDDEDL